MSNIIISISHRHEREMLEFACIRFNLSQKHSGIGILNSGKSYICKNSCKFYIYKNVTNLYFTKLLAIGKVINVHFKKKMLFF